MEVNFNAKEAKVTYSPEKTTVETVIKAIEKTPHMMGEGKYTAKVKGQ